MALRSKLKEKTANGSPWHNVDARAPQIDIGIKDRDRKDIASQLGRFLADTYYLYLKTHNYHWNVKGPMFHVLHNKFEEQYQEMWQAVDDIAERVRIIGHEAPGSYRQMAELTSITEKETLPPAEGMVVDLVEGHETVVRTARAVFHAAQKADDQATMDLAIERMRYHEKEAWMLRSLLE